MKHCAITDTFEGETVGVDASHAEILDVAAEALRREWTTDVRLTPAGVIVDYPRAAAVLLRARVAGASHQLPETVVVKRSNADGVVATESAGLAFVNQRAGIEGLAPRRLAVDTARQVLVMSDLEDPETSRLGDLLFDPADNRTGAALTAAQIALGRLHAAGIGQYETYRRILERHSGAKASRHAVNHLGDRLRHLPLVLGEHLQRSVSAEVEQEIRAVYRELFEPGPFTTMTHGDPTVGNVLYSPTAGVRFVDFETAGYRHALIDGCFARLRYLYSVWAHFIPLPAQKQLLEAYRAELVKGCPQAGDDVLFVRGLLAASVAWLAALIAHLDRVADHDVRWGRATYRQRIIAGLEHFVALADEYDSLPALHDAGHQLLDRLRDCWPTSDRQLGTYPALAHPAEPVD